MNLSEWSKGDMVKSEKAIETECIRNARHHGWWGIKLVPTFINGLPDRMFIGHGRVVFIEYKTETGHASPIQKVVHKKFLQFGHEVHICRNWEETRRVLDAAAE